MLIGLTSASTWHWLTPTLTAFGGFASGILTEWFRDSRAYRREKDALAEARKESRAQRRYVFQKETLLALQDAISELIAQIRSDLALRSATAETRKIDWRGTTSPMEKTNFVVNSRDRVITLYTRVNDDETRNLAIKVADTATTAFFDGERESAFDGARKAGDEYHQFCQRVGVVFRTLDELLD